MMKTKNEKRKTKNYRVKLKSFKFACCAGFLRNVVVVLTFALCVLSFASPVLAKPNPIVGDDPITSSPSGIINPVIGIFGTQPGNVTIAYLLALFLRLSLVAAGILLLAYFIWGGIQWLTSGGEEAKLRAAKDRLSNALVGLVLIALVLVVLAIINEVFGLNILRPELPTPK